MKKLILCFLYSSFLFAQSVKISQLPLISGSSVGSNDAFPFLYVLGNETARLKISDIFNVPSLTNAIFTSVTTPYLQQSSIGTSGTGMVRGKNNDSASAIGWRNAAGSGDGYFYLDNANLIFLSGSIGGINLNNGYAANAEVSISGTGIVRGRNNDTRDAIGWRNAAGSGDAYLYVDSSNSLVFAGSLGALNIGGKILNLSQGTVGAPGLTIASATTYGLYFDATSDGLAVAGNGVEQATFGTNYVQLGATSTTNQHKLNTSTASSSNCGSLSGGTACIQITINGTTRYIPYF